MKKKLLFGSITFFFCLGIYAQTEFEEVTGTSLEGLASGSIATADVNGNGLEDVLITGSNITNQRLTKLYINDGDGNFTEDNSVPFDGVVSGSVAFADVNGNGHKDLLISGLSGVPQRIAKLYINDGDGNFTEDDTVPFDGVTSSSVAFSDVDGDGDEDVLITGITSSSQRIAKLYLNDGDGNFTEDETVPFDGVGNGAVTFFDVDGDGDEDVLITGLTSSQRIAKLYINDGSGNFTVDDSVPFEGVRESSVAFSDVDGDGDEDVLITGLDTSNQQSSKLYINDGDGNFTVDISVSFEEVDRSSIAFSDVDGDGDQDVLITGRNSSNQPTTKLYLNDGDGNFTEDDTVPFETLSNSRIIFSDLDGDGNEDLLMTGTNSSNQRIFKLYRNLINNIDWEGSINTDWSNANNWQPNQVPQNNSIVRIPDVSNQPVINNTENVEIAGLTTQNNASLNVEGNLKVANRINNKGELTFKSTEDKTGQIDEFTGIFSGSGTVVVERYIPAGQRAFRLISPSVTTTTSIYKNWQENGASPIGFGTHITGEGASDNGFDETATNNPSLFIFDNNIESQSGGAAWETVSNTDVNTLTAGTPYRLLVRGDRNVDLTTNTPTATETVLRAFGDLHFGDFSPTISAFDANFNFVGNPYQATVNSKEVTYSGDINSNYIYVWDAQQGSNGSYVTIDMLDGSNTVGSNANEFIQPGQAFFIRNNLSVTTPPSITFTEASKEVSEEQLSTFSVPNYAKVNLQLFTTTSEGEQIVDAIGLRFSDDFTNEVNDADAGKMGNSGENLALVSNNQLLSIEQRKMPLLGEELQLFVNNYQAENFSFRLQLENWNEENEIFIKDDYLNTLTPISADEVYSFNVTPGIASSTSMLRFSLVFGDQTLSNDEFEDTSFSIYPNPTKEVFYVSGITENASLEMFDLLGRKVFSQNQVSNQQSINISQLSSGVYFVKVKEGEKMFTQKLVKE